MSDTTLHCPNCDSENVAVTEETMWMVNTMEHCCHSVKAHDFDAKVTCIACRWEGERRYLIKRKETP